jgi:hypothetical protein
VIKELLRWWRAEEESTHGLTWDEFEEYEFLSESMNWRGLTPEEKERFNELHNKRTAK